ncbi:MAG: type II toxin-antitoxin system Phd/YefM family antitoxin [Kiritimatiellae bacterium]|nr:type II toxin-antitoxin system Phd/YefM family antitoxin [Kiritimatiellia bacterium]
MPTTMNVNEAKTNFSSVLAEVENNRVTVTILRYGHPVAQIVPIHRHDRTTVDPELARIEILGDPCAADTGDWEEA